MKAAIYCRVSTDDQEKEGTSLQTQLESCLKYCESKGYEVYKRFSETYSGLTLERPVLTELRDAYKIGSFDVIVIYCLDRLTRDPSHGVILTQEFEKLNVRLEAVTETVELTDLGKLITYIRSFNSKIEAEKIRERTMRGKQAHVKMGNLPQGTGIGIYGYNWDKSLKKRVVFDQEADVVRNIFALVLKGHSFNKIAIDLNKSGIRSKSGSLWFPLTIRRIVLNPSYTGKTYYGQTKRTGKNKVIAQPKENWILIPGVTPRIISEDIFDRAQLAIQTNRQLRPLKPNAAYLLTGFAKCSKCGSPIGGTMLNGRYRYYQCRGAKPTATRGKICDAGYIKADEIERFVWNRFIRMLSSPSNQLDAIVELGFDRSKRTDMKPELDRQIAQLKTKLKGFEKRQEFLFNMLASGDHDHDLMLDTINTLKENNTKAENQLALLIKTRRHAETARIIAPKLSEYAKIIKNKADSLSLVDKRILLKAFEAKITALPGVYQFTCLIEAFIKYDETKDEWYAQKVKEFETRFPDVNVIDFVNQTGLPPEDSPFGQAVITFTKDLVTIERTLA